MTKTLVSIILPNYNHVNFLKGRIDSILNQTFQDFELILLDDKSTDNSVTILDNYKSHPKVSHSIFNQENSGNTFLQWQRGIELAQGDYIWIAESDDFNDPDFLERILDPMLKDKDIALSYCQSNKVNEQGEITGNWLEYTQSLDNNFFKKNFIMDGSEFIERFLIVKNVIPNASAVLVRSDCAKEASKYISDPKLKTCADWLYYVHALKGAKLSFIADALNNFRYHDSSVISNAIKTYDRIDIIDIGLYLRDHFKALFLKNDIAEKNKAIILELKSEKTELLFRSGYYFKGLKSYFALPKHTRMDLKLGRRIKFKIFGRNQKK